ncbi:MAG: NAD(P)-binding domain-containing protein [Nocardioides sp.]|nr:NAD(P)-binding domain-containing protein [Nocardioides sp.]
MDIAVLGTGSVGRTIAGRLRELGHAVKIGTRDPQATSARAEDDPAAPLTTYADAAARAELVVLAVAGAAALDVLALAGAESLAGKVLVDITNPLDFSAGFPPNLLVKDTDSLGEQIQRAFPEARVVKTLNTLTAPLMVHPKTLGSSGTVFMSGDDPAAKAVVAGLLIAFGHDDVIDLGGIETARGTEMWMPLWLRLMQALGTGEFNLKIVR